VSRDDVRMSHMRKPTSEFRSRRTYKLVKDYQIAREIEDELFPNLFVKDKPHYEHLDSLHLVIVDNIFVLKKCKDKNTFSLSLIEYYSIQIN
jgi:hypothetical protein